MRTTLSRLFVSLLLFGCATTPPTATSPATVSNAQMVRSLYDAFGRGDVPTVLAAFDPNIVWVEAENSTYADHNPYRGPQGVAQGVFTRIGQDWNNFRLNIDQVVDGGDDVVVLGRYTASNKGTGQPLNAQFAHVWKVRNGKIVSFQQYTDTAQYARVTGASK